jgi:hypothetical protein
MRNQYGPGIGRAAVIAVIALDRRGADLAGNPERAAGAGGKSATG